MAVYKSYKTRWYILFIYSMMGLLQGSIYNMWGPIYASVEAAFKLDTAQLDLMPLYANFAFVTLSLPSVWVLERWRLRKLVIVMGFLISLGCGIRCIPLDNLGSTILIHFSAVVNGVAGVVTMYLPGVISAKWFPPKERAMATAFGILLNTLGLAVSFIAGPLLVDDPSTSSPSESEINRIKKQYHTYTYIQTGIAVLLFLLSAIYYPDKPPTPPSGSADVPRLSSFHTGKRLLCLKKFWFVSLPMIAVFGTFNGWFPILSIDLDQQGVSQVNAGWIGFYIAVGGAIAGIIAGKVSDYFGKLKVLILSSTFLATEGAVWLLLIMHNFIPFTLTQTYISTILLGSAGSVLVPINCELAAQMCYPINEAITVSFLGIVAVGWTCVFEIILLFPIGTAWIEWFLAISCALVIPVVFVTRERHKRSEDDQKIVAEGEIVKF